MHGLHQHFAAFYPGEHLRQVGPHKLYKLAALPVKGAGAPLLDPPGQK